ncbi:MAG: aldo/keto reductase [Alphaproteobacteria bacterium]|nr:aldo/keto reductase [Alphaproteobacteria bacterium]
MEYRPLGCSGLMVSPLTLGMLQFGLTTGEDEARRCLDVAREKGINFLDTGNVYALGESERVTGRVIAGERDRWVVATKAGIPTGRGPFEGGLSRKYLFAELDKSLTRLATDFVDVFYLHVPDEVTPLDETLIAVAALIEAGKARYFGVSNYLGWQIAHIVRRCDELGLPRPIVCQPHYNAVDRVAEADILPACGFYGVGVAPYSPLARGILSGKYVPGEAPAADSRVGRKEKRMMEIEFRRESLAAAQQMAGHARARGISAAQFATAWVLNNKLVTTVIGGPRTCEQWRDYVAALDYRFSPEDEAFVDALVAPGHYSTPQFNDLIWPPQGRVPVRGERVKSVPVLPPTRVKK